MNIDKPIIEQIKEKVPTVNDVKEGAVNTVNSIGESIQEAKQGIQSSISDFSNKTMVDASDDFLQSNSLLAKFVFIILVFIIFMIVLKLSMTILGYFLSPKTSPYLIKGSISSSDKIIIYQDPKNNESIPILKSNDRNRGIEFTWSTWLYFTPDQLSTSTYKPIFVKGTTPDSTTGLYVSNGPGVYVTTEVSGNFHIAVVLDHVDMLDISFGATALEQSRDIVIANNLPIQKWFHLAIRMQNTVLDIYVNGTIVKRHNMDKAPKQNFHDVTVGGGFAGKLSNLRYYDYALNVFEINNIVMFGPNLKPSNKSSENKGNSSTYSYLSNIWYHNSYN
jgi:hypothetical protein